MIAPILSDPSAMENIRQMAEQMGLALPSAAQESKSDEQPRTAQMPDLSALSQMLGSFGGGAENKTSDNGKEGFLPDMAGIITKLAPLLGAMNKDDETTRFLSALRPMLSEERAQRLDDAEKMVSLMRVASILKESKLI